MNDAEKLVKYEKILKEKKRQTRIEDIEQLILGSVILTAMVLIYGYFAHLAFELQMNASNAYIVASVILLIILLFASATYREYKLVVKQGSEK